jgi:protein-S-isoprenylcysteine O-methyltransferase Ste14
MELSTGVAVDSTQATFAEPQRTRAEVPAIIAPGPWIAFTALGLGFAFDALHMVRVLAHVPATIRNAAALILIPLGLWYIYRANIIFHRAGTPFQPWRPTRTIAAQDIYAHTRNPMYQGFLILVLGIAVLLRCDGGVLMLLPAAMLVHYGVVMREEDYLDRRFGEGYRRYKAAVPRYGWPFGFGR